MSEEQREKITLLMIKGFQDSAEEGGQAMVKPGIVVFSHAHGLEVTQPIGTHYAPHHVGIYHQRGGEVVSLMGLCASCVIPTPALGLERLGWTPP